MSAAANAGRFARTIRQLTLGQVASRVLMVARLQAYRRVPALVRLQLRGDARLRSDGLAALGRWMEQRFPAGAGADRVARAEAILAGRFPLVGHELALGAPPIDWRPRAASRLWSYELHYLGFVVTLVLAARDAGRPELADRAWALVDDWRRAQPPGSPPGWEPYPVSLRLANLAAAWALGPPTEARARGLAPLVAAHARFVTRHLERHIGGNHLIANARALVIAGRLFDGPEAQGWARTGRDLMRTEIARQVLADGGHCERSPMYQALVLEQLLDCIALDPALGDLRAVARRMARWLGTMRHPDGGLALFNDTVAFPDPPPSEILDYARRIAGPLEDAGAAPVAALEPSGYYVLASGDGRLIVDCGEIGPPELAAHAHADTLGFELAWNGRRAIVDAGVAEYRAGPLRSYVRSTAAHNTVVVDGHDQSEMWASHRAGRRARPLAARVEQLPAGLRFMGAHDGYRRLGIVHVRHVLVLPPAWIVVDELVGRGEHTYESRIHLQPGLVAEPGDGDVAVHDDGGIAFTIRPFGGAAVAVERGSHCPAWGLVEENAVLRLTLAGPAPVTFGYALLPPGTAADLSVASTDRGVVATMRVADVTSRIESARPAAIVR